ncbi:hypothetical protein CEP51_011054 [Fusarium floridanum]|uniref:Uncharacterized protein n=1 Tax=Fusarium floridanum TaxID=1325733 RepID=A0A428RCJ9_9HYPO|nr:hypothetical protein CEP51_011054 [Fusarium floridanum]
MSPSDSSSGSSGPTDGTSSGDNNRPLTQYQGQRDSGSTTNPSEKTPNPNTTPVIYGLVPTDFFSFGNMSDGGSKKSGS